MRLTFRPMLWVSLLAIALFVVFILLGNWQVRRLHWKVGLIAETSATLISKPITLDAAITLGKAAEYHPVALTGHFDHAKEVYVYGAANGVPVYHVLTPFTDEKGRTLIIDRGIVPEELREPKKRSAGNVEGATSVVAVWRKPDPPNSMVPVDQAHRIWFSRDITGIAAAEKIALAVPILLEADKTPNPGGWPKGGQTVVTFANNHLQYAVTWYALAGLTLLGYFVVHISLGRLKITAK